MKIPLCIFDPSFIITGFQVFKALNNKNLTKLENRTHTHTPTWKHIQSEDWCVSVSKNYKHTVRMYVNPHILPRLAWRYVF